MERKDNMTPEESEAAADALLSEAIAVLTRHSKKYEQSDYSELSLGAAGVLIKSSAIVLAAEYEKVSDLISVNAPDALVHSQLTSMTYKMLSVLATVYLVARDTDKPGDSPDVPDAFKDCIDGLDLRGVA